MRSWRLAPVLLGLLMLAGCAADGRKASGALPTPTAAPAAPVPPPAPGNAAGFGNWAAVVVAGDWRSGEGVPSPTFDNARRDLSAAFVRAGFSPANIRQFSAGPGPDSAAEASRFGNVASTLGRLLTRAGEGCLVYITSHGSEDGVLMGRDLIPPWAMAQLLDSTCAGRPTVVVISACHSGVFLPALSAPNRLVVAAARADRSSFGCSEDDRYPYFDACTLQNLPSAGNFPALAEAARVCVSRREQAEDFPPSLPQISLGSSVAPILERLSFKDR